MVGRFTQRQVSVEQHRGPGGFEKIDDFEAQFPFIDQLVNQCCRGILGLLNLQIPALFLLLDFLFDLFKFLVLVGKEVFEIDIGFLEDLDIFIKLGD